MRFFILISLFTAFTASSQITVDSLKNRWKEKGLDSIELLDTLHEMLYDWDASPDIVNDLSIEYWNLAQKSKDEYHMAWSNMHRGLVLMKLADYENAKSYLDQSLNWAYANMDVKLIVSNHSMLGNIAYVLGDYNTMANLELKSWDLLKDSDDREMKSSTLTNLGVVYSAIGKHNEAKKYTLMGLYLNHDDIRDNVVSYQNLSVIYSNLELYDSAYIYCDSALQSSLKDPKKESLYFYNNMSTVHNRMSQILIQLGKKEESMKHSRLALDFSRKSKNKYQETKILFAMSKASSKDSTLFLLKEALILAKEIKSVPQISKISHELYIYYKRESRMIEALEMLEIYNLTKDSLNSDEALEKIKLYEFREKEEERRQKYQQEIAAKDNKFNTFLYFGGALGMLLLIYLILMRRRQLLYNKERKTLLDQIEEFKVQALKEQNLENIVHKKHDKLNREILDAHIGARLNDSDWSVVQNLYSNPSISNKELAENVSLSIEGAKSSLKKMYRLFEIPSSRNMKLALIIKIIAISKEDNVD